MNEDNAFLYVANKIERMSQIWPQQMKDSFKKILLNGYKVGFVVSKEDNKDKVSQKLKIDNNRGI